MIEKLNEQFGIHDTVIVQHGQNNLPKITVTNSQANAEIYLHGAHVTAFQPHGQAPVIWMSSASDFQSGKAIRGGIPVIWPWFGPHPTNDDLPQHGFVRTQAWQLASTKTLSNGATEIRLILKDNEISNVIWPHAFSLEVCVTVGKTLQVDLISQNLGKTPMVDLGAALHTYFQVGDIRQAKVDGLDSIAYLDKVQGFKQETQLGAISFAEEVDRIYLDTTGVCHIVDPSLGRTIEVAKTGSQSTVVWNPWVNKAKTMSDFPDDGYRTMVCVETTKAASDCYTLAPGETHTLSQFITVV